MKAERLNQPEVRDRLLARQRELLAGFATRRVELPLRYLRQQAHLTAPASHPGLAEKALRDAHEVARRLLARYGIDAADVAQRLEVGAETVEAVLRESGAPVVVLDLEDGVAPGGEARARANAVTLLRDVERGNTLCFLRSAGVLDQRCSDDLLEVLLGAGGSRPAGACPVDGIVLPKVRHPEELEWLEELLRGVELALGLPKATIRVSLQVETAWALLNLTELAARAGARLAGLILGTVDLSSDLLLPEVRYRHPACEWARLMLVTVGSAVGVPAIDGMTMELPVPPPGGTPAENRELVLARMRTNYDDCQHSIESGMSGRWTGHPLQLVATEIAFRAAFPRETLDALLRELEIFAAASEVGRGAIATEEGKLIDVATDHHARLLLRRAAAWGQLDAERGAALGLTDPPAGDGPDGRR